MKYLMIALLLLCSCANKTISSSSSKTGNEKVSANKSGLALIDAYQQTVTGGKEKDDGTHTSTTYSMVVKKDKGTELQNVYLFGERKDYEAFEYEGKFYIIVKVFPEFPEQEKGQMISTDAAADVYFNKGGETRVLSVPSFRIKESTQGK